MELTTIIVIAGILSIWLMALSFFVFSFIGFFNKLTKGAKGEELRLVLEKILRTEEVNLKETKLLQNEIKRIDRDSLHHVQKVGLVRFNPFEETGGDHSFSAAFLDGEDTGLILTALHTRERTRVYAKDVKNGKTKIELSMEEKKALEKAKKGVN